MPRSALLKPSDAEQRLGHQMFALGDRVVYVQDSGKVPIAVRGTVIGVSRTATTKLLDVVFDTTFMSGTTLGERCPPFRGQTVPASSVPEPQQPPGHCRLPRSHRAPAGAVRLDAHVERIRLIWKALPGCSCTASAAGRLAGGC